MLIALCLVSIGLVIALVVLVMRDRNHTRYRSTHTKLDAEVGAQITAAREHSVKTSRGTVLGNAAQHLAPFMPEMVERFVPSDWRFLGSPVDFVVFEGLHKGLVERIVLVEVKTSRGVSAEQRAIKAAADAGVLRLDCEILRVPVQSGLAVSRRPRRTPRES